MRKLPRFDLPKTQVMIAFVLFFIVAAGMLTPNVSVPYKHFDKFIHFISFWALGVALFTQIRLPNFAILAFVCILAIGLEYAQQLSPGRTLDAGDIVANLAGVFGAVLICVLIKHLPVSIFRLTGGNPRISS